MCGIGGVIKYGDAPIEESVLALLLTGNEHRGNDATGIALSQADGSVNIFKKDVPAWQFIKDKGYISFISEHLRNDTWAALLHTRAATQGNPCYNKNNHPLSNGRAAIIHNGVIQNDNQLFNSNKFERSAETDSDIIRAYVDAFGITQKAIDKMNSINGSVAGGAFHPDYPKHMLLFRSGSPMCLGSTNDFFLFASERGTLYKAMKPYVKRFNTWFQIERIDAALSPMADDTAWIMGPNGQGLHAKFKTLNSTYNEPVRRTYENYESRKCGWKLSAERDKESEKLPRIIKATTANKLNEGICPKCSKIWTYPADKPVGDFTCNQKSGGCGATIIELPSVKKISTVEKLSVIRGGREVN